MIELGRSASKGTADAAEEEVAPEPATGASGGYLLGYALTQGSRCLSERSEKRGQIGLQLAADALREDGS